MTQEIARKANELLGRISILKYNNATLNRVLESGQTSMLGGIIDVDLGRDAIREQLNRNDIEIRKLQKEFDEL